MPAAPSTHRFSLRSSAVVNVVFFAGAALALLLLILRRTQGHFSYCLDDPYIHMALAERLRHGLYGINAGEPASPSSSIVWPLLLVPFAGTALMPWVPLVLNVMCGGATAWLLGRFVERYFKPGWRSVLLGLLLTVGLNLPGLVYTGLEHSLEVLLCVLAAFAALAVLDGERVPGWAVVAAAVLPSVRYEGVLVTFAVAVVLWAARRRGAAVALVPASLVPAAVFGGYLHHLGLPVFPLSVLVKSSYKFHDHSSLPVRIVRLVTDTLVATLKEPERMPQFLLVVLLGWLIWRTRRTSTACTVLVGAALAGTVQVFLGPVGWFYRYEIYCLAFTLPVAIAAFARLQAMGATTGADAGIRGVRVPGAHRAVPRLLLVATGALAVLYARAQIGVPKVAAGIWQEQAQLGRFASQFETGPVALNDLGWVSFLRTPGQYTLDLVGLGSYEAFGAGERSSEWLGAITHRHGVGLVMIYPEWFGKTVPGDWTPLAKLCARDVDPKLSASASRVVFYATPLGDQARLLDELGRFGAALPAGSVLELRPANLSQQCSTGPQHDGSAKE